MPIIAWRVIFPTSLKPPRCAPVLRSSISPPGHASRGAAHGDEDRVTLFDVPRRSGDEERWRVGGSFEAEPAVEPFEVFEGNAVHVGGRPRRHGGHECGADASPLNVPPNLEPAQDGESLFAAEAN